MNYYTDGMTLEEQIGQLLMVGFSGHSVPQEIIELIERYHVGNIILFSRNIHEAEQVFALTSQLQDYARKAGQRFPLLIAIDQENGIVQRMGEVATLFPGNMALGAIGSQEIARAVAQATGEELRALGINMNLAPVVDVNNNPANPVIGVRSFGEDARQVGQLGGAMVQGYKEAGIVSCLKHFPGHGDTAVDSHLALPTIPYPPERLQQLELVPFRMGIAAGAECIMSAHIAFPALSGSTELPATLAPAIITGLLREQLGFEGVVMSDCLEMHAVLDAYGTGRGAVLALQAGIDLVLVSHHFERQRESIAAICTAVHQGELDPARIRISAGRIQALKAQHLSWDTLPSLGASKGIIASPAHQHLQERAYELSTTLVRNEAGLLPLRLQPGEQLVVLAQPRNILTMVEDRPFTDAILAAALREHCLQVRTVTTTGHTVHEAYQQVLAETGEGDILVVATVNAHIDQAQGELLRLLTTSGRRIIGIAVRNPYDLAAFPALQTYLVTYEYTRPSLQAAARVLFGERDAHGKLPVSMPDPIP
ncbi:MAG TPA: beta-N-acetylhexosaminidase [Ktedonobacteraceae bacterium]|nr:beta-N-acetylhexosaminidase [Ktedonobacteraceae bacterium]